MDNYFLGTTSWEITASAPGRNIRGFELSTVAPRPKPNIRGFKLGAVAASRRVLLDTQRTARASPPDPRPST